MKTSVQEVADEELAAETIFSQTCSDTLLTRSKNSKYLSVVNQERYAAERAQPPSPAVEPIVVAIAACEQPQLKVRSTIRTFDISLEYEKANFDVVIIVVDFLCIFILMAFVLFLEKKQNEFAMRFSQQSIEMDDFSLEFNNIPKDKFFRGNEHVLRAYLWRKLEEVMLDELQNQQGEYSRRSLQNQ